MKNKRFQKVVCFILSVTMLLSVCGFTVFGASDEDYSYKRNPVTEEKNPYSASTLEEMQALVGTLSYAEYLDSYSEQREDYINRYKADPTKFSTIVFDVLDFTTNNTNGAEVVSSNQMCNDSMASNPDSWVNFADEDKDNTVYLPAQGYASWQTTLTAEQAGFYYIRIHYYSVKTSESSISAIERKLKLDNNKIPFDEVSSLTFDKNWVYKYGEIEDVVTKVPGAKDSYDVKYELVDEEGKQGYYKIVTEVKDGVKTVKTYRIMQDINGNSMAPETNPEASWSTYSVRDTSGYYDGAFEFYFGEGTRTITLEAEREPMIIKSIELIPVSDPVTLTVVDGKTVVKQHDLPSYAEILKEYKANGWYKAPAFGNSDVAKVIEIQAEFPDFVSDSSVSATNDNTSAINYPISNSAQLYNVIGENSYRTVGQWAAYKFKVNKTGLYNFGMRFKQDALQGMYICRTIKLSGGHYGDTPTVPFAEAYQAEFNYSKKWQSTFVSKDNTDFMFYFEEGVEYTVYFECSLGTLKEYIQRVEVSLDKINAAYLSILQLTGTDPDEYRDYNYISVMPEVLVTLLEEAIELMAVKEGLEKLCGTNGSHIATLETIAILLNTMGKDDGIDIAANMSTLKSYLGTLGTWINNSKSASMMVDSIWVVPAVNDGDEVVSDDSKLPRAEAGFFEAIWFEIKSFISSFFVNYDQMGLTTIPTKDTLNIDVWLASGRDQSQIWRTMIDANSEDGFTYNTGTAVSLKLVTGGTLLPSILSRKGPDVYIGLGAADVINYAIREAVLGISGDAASDHLDKDGNPIFDTTYYSYRDENGKVVTTTEHRAGQTPVFVSNKFDDAVVEGENFAKAAMDTVTLLGSSYGIPQTMTFAMMFYRMDVLADLGLRVPETWQELLSILPVLQTNNMSIGVSYIEALDFMIYQSGENMWKYTDESLYDSKYAGARINLDNRTVLEIFDFTCRLYSDFSFPVSYDASNRFRTGEMPIIIGGYSGIYNTLTVYATEIEGLWEFCSIPGMVGEDKSISYDSLAYITASVILYGCKGDELLASWQFLQWQTGETAQADYGNRMVALIGPSAKYETANLKAIDNLSWTASEKAAIMNQMDHLSSIVNYPGSYIINRYMQFAFLDAVNESADPIDALSNYIEAINSEIARKREEFGLWVPESSDDEPPQLNTAG